MVSTTKPFAGGPTRHDMYNRAPHMLLHLDVGFPAKCLNNNICCCRFFFCCNGTPSEHGTRVTTLKKTFLNAKRHIKAFFCTESRRISFLLHVPLRQSSTSLKAKTAWGKEAGNEERATLRRCGAPRGAPTLQRCDAATHRRCPRRSGAVTL